MGVQRGKGLVQHEQLRLGDEHPGEGGPLLLPAGELAGELALQPLQPEAADVFRHPGGVLFPQPGGDVLLHRHGGEQGVVLEQQAHPPLLGPQVDLFLRVEQHPAVHHDAARVRPLDARDAPQGHGLAAARGPQQGQHLVPGGKGRVQPEAAQIFSDVYLDRHRQAPYQRF